MMVCWSTVAVFADEKVDNPEYEHWAQFKPGSFSKVKWTVVVDGVTIKMVVTTTLKKVTSEKVEIQTKTVTSTEGVKDNLSVTNEPIPAKVKREKLKIEPKEVGKLPDGREVLDLKRGQEKIKIRGEEIATEWIETKIKIKNKKEDRTIVSKTWTSEDIPGRVVKMVSGDESGMITDVEQNLEEFKANQADDGGKEEAKNKTKAESVKGAKDQETKKAEEGKSERKDKK
jgi:hypothetical protein